MARSKAPPESRRPCLLYSSRRLKRKTSTDLDEAAVRDKMAPAALGAEQLTCIRGERRLFAGVSFELRNGGLLEVRGRNGSGKTSLLRIACGLLSPVGGAIEWNGEPAKEQAEEFQNNLAYVGHLNAVKDELDAFENLRFASRVMGLDPPEASIADALSAFAIGTQKGVPCKVFSQGQKRRLALARLQLSTSRALWILDEPFASLDSAGMDAMRGLLEGHLARGGLALLTTHQEVPIAAANRQRIELGQ